MSAVVSPSESIVTLADLVAALGDVPLSRVRFHPAPGTATEADVIAVERRENRLCELIDGVLVEKPIGYRESFLALAIASFLRDHVDVRNLGLVTGADGMMRLFAGLVRIPDVAFVAWDRIPEKKVPSEPIPNLVPDLAVEVLSPSNTAAEMARKCSEYFLAGTRLLWLVDPEKRTVAVYRQADECVVLNQSETLDGEPVFLDFQLPLCALFAELDRQAPWAALL
jgi:Uma2 family endonuclease